jgi:type 1 fimbriae regulatory protein FimB
LPCAGADLDLPKARIWISRLGNGNSGSQPLAEEELEAIAAYLAIRRDRLPWLFLSERGQPLTRQAVNYLIASAAGRAGIEGVHPHMLRHTCGFAAAEDGHSRKFIKYQLGHRNSKYAANYLLENHRKLYDE